MEVAMVGLGRMGGNMARRLLRGGHRVVVWNRTYAKAEELGAEGAEPVKQLTDVVKALSAPRAIWIMLPYGDATQAAIDELTPLLDEGDILIDGGNSPFQHDIERGAQLKAKGIRYLDAGTSGGVWGLDVGYCLMVGGDRSAFEQIEPLLKTLAPPGHGYEYCGGHGSGHFVKMVHNGIEYGMMQAYAEGFELLERHRVGPRPRLHRRPVEPGQRGAQLAARAGRGRAQEGSGAGAHHRLRRGHRRGPLDRRAGDRPQRAHAGDLRRALHPLPLAPDGHLQRQGAGRPAQRVRRPRRQGEGVTVDDDVAGHLTYDEPDYGDEVGVHVTGKAKAAGSASPFGGERHPDPCSLVMFGVTGDLAHRKLIPALYDLGCHGVLPFGTTLVGYGRQEMTDDQFRDLMREAIDDHYGEDVVDGQLCDRLLQAPRYVQGQFDDPEGFKRLAAVLDELDGKGARGNRMFYLATPPSQFEVLIEQLGASGLARRGAYDGEHGPDGARGWTRVVIEKPFGRDLETAHELDRVIGQVFDERQVYRIDHYLAKETVQNLLVLRFANGIFEPVWNRRYVDFVEITAAETLGVEHRGPYYEEAGALRDMITPHLIQLFTLVAMEPPASFDADGVRDEKMKVLRAVRPIPPQSVGDWAVRAQYVQGLVDGEDVPAYRAEERVAPDSYTETFAALKLLVDNWRWQGVPFYLRTGKRLARRVTEIAIHFKRPPVRSSATPRRAAACSPTCSCCACSRTRASR